MYNTAVHAMLFFFLYAWVKKCWPWKRWLNIQRLHTFLRCWGYAWSRHSCIRFLGSINCFSRINNLCRRNWIPEYETNTLLMLLHNMYSHSKNGRWNTYSVDQLIIKYVMGVRALGLSCFESNGVERWGQQGVTERDKSEILLYILTKRIGETSR